MFNFLLRTASLSSPALWYRLRRGEPHPLLDRGAAALTSGSLKVAERSLNKVWQSGKFDISDRARAAHLLVEHYLNEAWPDKAESTLMGLYNDMSHAALPGAVFHMYQAKISELRGETSKAVEFYKEACRKAECFEDSATFYLVGYSFVGFCIMKALGEQSADSGKTFWLEIADEFLESMSKGISETETFYAREACIAHLALAIKSLKGHHEQVVQEEVNIDRLARLFGESYEPVAKLRAIFTQSKHFLDNRS